MQAVVLKGGSDGYEIKVASDADFDIVLSQLKQLLVDLRVKTPATINAPLGFNINTQKRLLDAEQKAKIERIFARFDEFSLHRIAADVITNRDALAMMESRSVHVCAQTIRNGQEVLIKGDVLFLGTVHHGGVLKATGTIYVLGKVLGIVHAGFADNYRAVCVGLLADAQQVRIGDKVKIMAEANLKEKNVVAYVSDIHAMEFADVKQLKTLRPKLFAGMGGIN